MNSFEPLDLGVLAIMAMAIATVLMRIGGFWLMAYVPMTPRVRRMLEALPGSIVAAIVLPVIVKNGPVAVVAVVAAAIVMILRRNQVLAVAAGVTVAALVRYAAV